MADLVTSFTLPRWADLHLHFRQGPAFSRGLIAEALAGGAASVLAMPNTKPPLTKVFGEEWSVQSYTDMLRRNGANTFENLIVPLYLSPSCTPETITVGARNGNLKAAKYYPPHGTTNSAHGLPMAALIGGDVLRAMEDAGVILCIHGEQHDLLNNRWFGQKENAESIFYKEWMPRLLETHPRLKIVCEHITTAEAVAFVEQAPAHVVATVTPQHLMFEIGDVLKGMRTHLCCMPIAKFGKDVAALRRAVTNPNNTKFFAGTDSAPHPLPDKQLDCGCAFGCFTGRYGALLYAEAFEMAGCLLNNLKNRATLRRFLCELGPAFYGFAPSQQTMTLRRTPQRVTPVTIGRVTVIPLPLGLVPETHLEDVTIPWSLELT